MVDCTLWVGSELLPQANEFKYPGVFFTSESKMGCEWTGELVQCQQAMYWNILVKRELEDKAFDLPVDLCPDPHLLALVLGSDRKNDGYNGLK